MVLTPAEPLSPSGALQVNRAARDPGPPPPDPGPATTLEPAQPVFARYWLHGKGPAPAGNLPVAVHLSPGRIALPEPAEEAEDTAAEPALGHVGTSHLQGRLGEQAPREVLRLTVACGPAAAAGTVRLVADGGLVLEPAGPLRYALRPQAYAGWDLTVRAPARERRLSATASAR